MRRRFVFRLEHRIEIAPGMNAKTVWLPPMLIQPFAENAIKHGLLQRPIPGGQLLISIRQEQARLHIEITDNGIGRAASAEINARRKQTHQSFATSATKQRLELLNNGRERLIAVAFEDLKHENGEAAGTTVKLQIPV